MGRRARRSTGALPVFWRFLALALVSGAVYLLWPLEAIQLVTEGAVTRTVPVPRGAEVHLDFRHSVTRSMVREVFILPGTGGFTLIRTEQSDFGAGLPAESFGLFRQEEGKYINSGIDLALPEIPLRVSAGSEQSLAVQNSSEIVFLDYFEPNSPVIVRSRKLPRAGLYLLGRRGVK